MIVWLLRRFRYVQDLEHRMDRANLLIRESYWFPGPCTRDGVAIATRNYIKSIIPVSIWLDFESNTDDSVPVGTIRVRMSTCR